MVVCMGVANRLKHLCTSTFSKKTSKGPESAVLVPESAVFPTYDLEVSKIFRNFALVLGIQARVWAAAQQSSSELGSAFALHHPCTTAIRIQVQRRFLLPNDRSGCRIRPRLAPNCASWLTFTLKPNTNQSPSP